MIKQMQFRPKGMNRDNAVSVFNSELAYQIDNMRIKASDSNNQFSLTSIKGTKKWFEGLKGTPIGHATINNNYILFTTGDTTEGQPDHIYKINSKGISSIYNGNLKFSINNPIETLTYYENEDIQKVYWTDGLNLPRAIDINNTYLGSEDLNFVKSIIKFPSIKVESIELSGSPFNSGIVLYLVTGYNKFESESNILVQSNINYIAYADRGGKPDEYISTGFKITLEGVNNFEYIKVYRLYKSTLEEVGKVDLIADLKVSNTISIIDSGNSLSSIDPTELLYIGSVPITAKTMTLKDGTLFLGNVETKSTGLGSIKYNETTNLFDYFYNIVKNKSQSSSSFTVLCSNKTIEYNGSNDFYNYTPNTSSGEELKYFKKGETYRLGFIGVDLYGVKSDVIWVGDYEQEVKVIQEESSIKAGDFTLTINEDLIALIKEAGFRQLIPVVVYPTLADRTIKAQGIVSPTVYNVEDRYNGTCDVQSSWFFRPSEVITRETYNIKSDGTENKNYVTTKFQDLSYKHGHDIGIHYKNYYHRLGMVQLPKYAEVINLSEIQSSNGGEMVFPSLFKKTSEGNYENYESLQFVNFFKHRYFIDSNIITFHSPEIENDELLYTYDFLNLTFRITGYVYKNNYDSYRNYYNYSYDKGLNSKNRIYNYPYYDAVIDEESPYWSKNIVSSVMPSYYDGSIKEQSSSKESHYYFYAVHPWHRSGSLNDDVIPTGTGTRTAVLNYKVGSRMDVYKGYSYLDNYIIYDDKSLGGNENLIYDYSILLFNFNENQILKINNKNNYKTSFIYKGNIDTIVPANLAIIGTDAFTLQDDDYKVQEEEELLLGYPIYKVSRDALISDEDDNLNLNQPIPFLYRSKEQPEGSDNTIYNMKGKDPVSVRYKSTPHVVIDLGTYKEYYDENIDNYTQRILPTIELNKGDGRILSLSNIFDNRYLLPYYTLKSYSGVYDGGDGNTSIKLPKVSLNLEDSSIIWVGELYSDNVLNRFGGDDKSVLRLNTWLLCGEAVNIDSTLDTNSDGIKELSVKYTIGDTYFQRYDCLKTYPYAEGDVNSVVNIVSAPIETRINLDLRTDRNRGLEDNTSIRPTNFNLFNPVYNQTNNFFKYHVIDLELFNNNTFKNIITWTKTKLSGASVDTWTNITMANILDLDGDKGEITALRRFNNNVLAFLETGISLILYNENVQISTNQGVPIEIGNSGKVQGKRYISEQIGCTNKWSICESPLGLYFIDDKTEGIYLFNGQLTNLSDLLGFSAWIKQYYSTSRSNWNPDSFNNFITYYDKLNREVLFVNEETCLAYSEYLQQFQSFYNYSKVPYFGYIENQFISVFNKSIYKNEAGNPSEFYGKYYPFGVTVIANADSPYDKVFNTLEFRTSTVKDLGNPENDLSLYTFDTLETWNDYQKGLSTLDFLKYKYSNLKRKFRIWRANIPREGLNRMRNPWLFIKLTNNSLYYTGDADKNYNYPLELHDMIVHYFI